MNKHWWQSATIKGALVAALGYILSPEVVAVLPPKVANIVVVVGALASVIGLRRAVGETIPGR